MFFSPENITFVHADKKSAMNCCMFVLCVNVIYVTRKFENLTLVGSPGADCRNQPSASGTTLGERLEILTGRQHHIH